MTCTLSDVVGDPDYRPRDGDAAFLPVGTELREIAGYRSDFRLAAHEDGRWRIYEAADVPDAGTGEDLLDIRGKVRRVHLVEGDDEGTGILRTVDRPARVTALVDAVLAAPVMPEAEAARRFDDETPVFVRFDLADGTTVQRAWHVRAGVLSRRVEAPAALLHALRPAGR
ncbi:MAG: hypothetical protein M3Q27_12155 [Actinomycetota bacterium]|nr:hypothetical protein [Actinomycetota bacterium]